MANQRFETDLEITREAYPLKNNPKKKKVTRKGSRDDRPGIKTFTEKSLGSIKKDATKKPKPSIT
jgi:hypothetical protein